nr:uncharacterized protein LOC124221140 [Neodiprion pinetum]
MTSQLIFLTVAVVVLAQFSLALPARQSVNQEALSAAEEEHSEEAAGAAATGNSENTATEYQNHNIIKLTLREESLVIEINSEKFAVANKDIRHRRDNVTATNTDESSAALAHVQQSIESN